MSCLRHLVPNIDAASQHVKLVGPFILKATWYKKVILVVPNSESRMLSFTMTNWYRKTSGNMDLRFIRHYDGN